MKKNVIKDNVIKDKVLRGIRVLVESDNDQFFNPIKVVYAFSSNCIEHESDGDNDKSLSIKEYLNKIRPYLSHMIKDFKTQGEWKIELTMIIDFMSSGGSKDFKDFKHFEDSKNSKHSKDSKDSNETSLHVNSNNIEIMIGNEINEIIEELLEPLLQRYQKVLEE